MDPLLPPIRRSPPPQEPIHRLRQWPFSLRNWPSGERTKTRGPRTYAWVFPTSGGRLDYTTPPAPPRPLAGFFPWTNIHLLTRFHHERTGERHLDSVIRPQPEGVVLDAEEHPPESAAPRDRLPGLDRDPAAGVPADVIVALDGPVEAGRGDLEDVAALDHVLLVEDALER